VPPPTWAQADAALVYSLYVGVYAATDSRTSRDEESLAASCKVVYRSAGVHASGAWA